MKKVERHSKNGASFNIDEAMNIRLFAGKCLNEITTELVMD